MLADSPEIAIIGEARNLEEIDALLSETRPDVVVLDDSLWQSEAALPALKAQHCALVLLSEDNIRLGELAAGGLRGWALLDKSAEAEELSGAILAASANLMVLSPFHATKLNDLFPIEAPRVQNEGLADAGLTPREMQVLQLVARGLPNKNIANLLNVSLSTAKFHVASILGKLNASSRTEAVTQGAKRGLVIL